VPNQLLSIMAHALGPDGRALAVGDGLGVPIESWQLGDVLFNVTQSHCPKMRHVAHTGYRLESIGWITASAGQRVTLARAAIERY